MTKRIYEETFDEGTNGWYAWISNQAGPKPLERKDGIVTSRSPWWIDYNHAPPGAGYLHMVFCLNSTGPVGEHHREVAGPNRFVNEQFPLDFRGAKLTLKLKGELLERGAKLVLLAQASHGGTTSPWVLTSQPFSITPEWSEQTIELVNDESAWTSLGSRFDRTDMYGSLPLDTVLGKLTSNIMLVMFPLDVAPMGPLDGDPHRLRPERDYPVWRHRLPEGYINLDTVRLEFAG
ncbi:MAG: hypothetical protein WD065_07340 [Planctomycetaceae bacterium]